MNYATILSVVPRTQHRKEQKCQSAEMVDRLVSGTSVHYGRMGSTPISGTVLTPRAQVRSRTSEKGSSIL